MNKSAKLRLCITIVGSLVSGPLHAQVVESKQDSVHVAQPENEGKKKERLSFRSFFRDKTMEATTSTIGYRKLPQMPFEDYQGKIIREIKVLTLDPFDYSLGMIGQQENKIFDNRFYSKIGVGILINNLNLVFNTFQLSLAFYPVMPDGNINVFGFNPFKTNNIGFGNFEIGKPSVIGFE